LSWKAPGVSGAFLLRERDTLTRERNRKVPIIRILPN